MTLDHIGQQIKKYRERVGVSQRKLGLALGLSDKAVSSYESGRTLPPIETLARISEELEVPIEYLISDSENTKLKRRLSAIENSLDSIKDDIEEIMKQIP